ncbi:MAG: TraB/GumN family protein [Prevotellaceae bacterium]|jgi:uncharacterized protein YbaP (TraB family)|nr:TraB/GumN family protein [Prevotellaceae bacterium]
MKKTIAMIALGLISAGYSFSQTSVWKISKGKNEIYLGGSVHALRASDFPLPKEFDVAFAKAQTLVLEADVKADGILQKVISESMLPDGQTLKSVLKAEQYQAICDAAEAIGMSMTVIEKMKPGMALMTLSTMMMQKQNISAQGVDMYYYDKAAGKNKSVEFLESIDFQLDLICNVPFNLDEFIKYSLEDMNQINAEQEFSKIVEEWRAGKATAEDEIKKMKKNCPSVYKAMFSDRNHKWMPVIEKYLEDNKIEFIIVGSAHLWGDDGLLTLLKKKGYTIGQLRIKN